MLKQSRDLNIDINLNWRLSENVFRGSGILLNILQVRNFA